MNKQEALSYLSTEASSMADTTNKAELETAITVLDNAESNASEQEEAIDNLNDLYWDAIWSDQNKTGQAIFAVAYTVDPNKPFPNVRF